MNVPPINLNAMPGGVNIAIDTPVPTLPTSGTDKELYDASRDFVALLYTHMFQTMREAGQSDDGEGMFNSFETSMFMGFFDQEVGKKFADEGGNHLVDSLYRQIARNVPGSAVAREAMGSRPQGELTDVAPVAPVAEILPGVGQPPPVMVPAAPPAMVVPPALPPAAVPLPAGVAPVVAPPPLPSAERVQSPGDVTPVLPPPPLPMPGLHGLPR